MLSSEEMKEEYIKNVSTYVLLEVRDLSQLFDDILLDDSSSNKDRATQTHDLIEKSETLLQTQISILNKMQIHFNIATGYMNIYGFLGAAKYELLMKATLNFRIALKLYEYEKDTVNDIEQKLIDHLAMKCHVNLGNIMRTVGRYIFAIDSYNNTLLIDNGFAMASLNLSFTLLSYSGLQIKKYEQQYYHHAAYNYYKHTIKYKVNLEDASYIDGLKKKIGVFHPEYIENFLQKELNLPDYGVSTQEEIDYRIHLQICNLFLDACGEILREPCFAVDSVILPESKLVGEKAEFYGLFNQIKAEYIHGRYLWYATTVEILETPKYVEKENDFASIKDDSVFTVNDTLLRAAYRILYSVFDKIGYFVNHYFNVGLEGRRISFKNIWRSDVPRPIKFPTSNAGLCALYWLQKDLYDEKEMDTTSPFSVKLAEMRNDMEHNALISVNSLSKANPSAQITKYVMDGQIEQNVYKIMKLLREAIIYLSIAVNEDVKSKDGLQNEQI